MRFLVAGSSGFLGTALRVRLAEQGHEVVRLVRRQPVSALEYCWNPDRGELDHAALAGVDVAVNLAGAGVADRPWTQARRELILSSRVNSTQTLARALAERAEPGAPPVTLLQASGASRYGTISGAQPYDENSPAGDDYLSQVVVQWEAAAQPAVDAGVRTVFLRTSPVLDPSGGALQIMRVPWSLGLGAQLGDGRQHMPLVGLDDYLRVLEWAANNPDASGPYNVTIPQPTTNAEFTKALGVVLRRPTLLRAPAFVLRTALGELAEQLLGDLYVVPTRLTAAGFVFSAPDVTSTLRAALRPA
jgi:uncharacterized protein (TIGR01777 family)